MGCLMSRDSSAAIPTSDPSRYKPGNEITNESTGAVKDRPNRIPFPGTATVNQVSPNEVDADADVRLKQNGETTDDTREATQENESVHNTVKQEGPPSIRSEETVVLGNDGIHQRDTSKASVTPVETQQALSDNAQPDDRTFAQQNDTHRVMSNLGDIWECDHLHQEYEEGRIRSIPVADSADNEDEDVVHVEFRNESPTEALILCWISSSRELHHFYDLPPGGGGRMEISHVGDAFVLFENRNDEAETLAERKMMCTTRNLVGAYRPKIKGSDEQRHNVIMSSKISDTETNSPTQAIIHEETPRTRNNAQLRGSSPKRQKLDQNEKETFSNIFDRWKISVKQHSLVVKPKLVDTRKKVYQQIQFGPWTVLCEPGCWDEEPIFTGIDQSHQQEDNQGTVVDKDQIPPSLRKAFQTDIDALTRRIPQQVLEVLCQSTHIYMNTTHPYGQAVDNPVGCFHPGIEWLEENLMNVDKCKQVEFYNVQEYYKHRRLWGAGGMILHELCHAYHNKHLPAGYENRAIIECYEKAMEEGLYDNVSFHSGFKGYGSEGQHLHTIKGNTRHYACSNAMEYFAELSVAFLSPAPPQSLIEGEVASSECNYVEEVEEYNKWFPHNRVQLREHDPRGYELLRQLWGV